MLAGGRTGRSDWTEMVRRRAALTISIPFIEKKMGQEVPADTLGDEWKGYVLRITGGNG